MSAPRVTTRCKIGLTLALLCAGAARADAQQSRDAHLSVTVMVIASATRVEHAEVNALSSTVTGPLEREVQMLVTAASSGESVLSLVARLDGVTIDVIGADGQFTPLAAAGMRVARTTAGREVSAPVRLRLRSQNVQLLDQAAIAPVSLVVDSAVR